MFIFIETLFGGITNEGKRVNEMNCLYDMTYDELKELVEEVLHLEYWCVRDDELRNRMDSIAYSDRFKELKERAFRLTARL